MPPIELGPTRPVSAADVRIARQAGGQREHIERPGETTSPVELSDVLDPGQAPIDSDRVITIRKAIERGEYPIIPTKIADAIIAAGILLRSGQ